MAQDAIYKEYRKRNDAIFAPAPPRREPGDSALNRENRAANPPAPPAGAPRRPCVYEAFAKKMH
jgi:hypothetical protein